MQSALFFDWYSASIQAPVETVVGLLHLAYNGHVWEIATPRHGYERSDKLVNPAGETVLQIMYGGLSQGSKVHVSSSGSHAQRFAYAVRKAFPVHEVVRADVAIDYDNQGAWRSLYTQGVAVATATSVSNRFIGKAETENHDITDSGRSLYIGSRSSVSMIRIYEKAKKMISQGLIGCVLSSNLNQKQTARLSLKCRLLTL